jgi:hypothetical protein
MKQVYDLVSSIRAVADDLEAVVEMFEDGFRIDGEDEAKAPATQIQTDAPPVTLEEVRAKLTDLNMAGRGEQVRTLLKKHGAGKLSEINPSHYAELLAEAEAIT